MIKLKHSSKYRSTAKMPGYLNSLGMGLKNKSIQYSSLFSRIGYASFEWFSIVLLCLFISMCPFSADIIRLLHFKSISKCSAQAKCSMDAKYNKIGQSWRSSIKIKTENLLNKIYTYMYKITKSDIFGICKRLSSGQTVPQQSHAMVLKIFCLQGFGFSSFCIAMIWRKRNWSEKIKGKANLYLFPDSIILWNFNSSLHLPKHLHQQTVLFTDEATGEKQLANKIYSKA